MKMPWLAFGTWLIAASVACSASAGDMPRGSLTMQAACERVRLVVSKQLSADHGADEYRCEGEAQGPKGYYVFALRSNYPAPKGAGPGWVGSALVGWYAVRASDGQVRDWDVANLKLESSIK